MASNISMGSVDSDVFFVEQLSDEPSPQRNNSPNNLSSTELWRTHPREMPTISLVAFPKPDIVTLDDDSNESRRPNEFGRQLPIIPPNLDELNVAHNPFNNLATMAMVNCAEDSYDDNYSPQSIEASDPSTISTPPLNLSTIEGWETPHTTTDDDTIYSDDDARRFYFLPSSPSPPPPPESWKENWALECPSQEEGECRSMFASLVNNCSLSWRTYQARRQQTKNSRLQDFF